MTASWLWRWITERGACYARDNKAAVKTIQKQEEETANFEVGLTDVWTPRDAVKMEAPHIENERSVSAPNSPSTIALSALGSSPSTRSSPSTNASSVLRPNSFLRQPAATYDHDKINLELALQRVRESRHALELEAHQELQALRSQTELAQSLLREAEERYRSLLIDPPISPAMSPAMSSRSIAASDLWSSEMKAPVPVVQSLREYFFGLYQEGVVADVVGYERVETGFPNPCYVFKHLASGILVWQNAVDLVPQDVEPKDYELMFHFTTRLGFMEITSSRCDATNFISMFSQQCDKWRPSGGEHQVHPTRLRGSDAERAIGPITVTALDPAAFGTREAVLRNRSGMAGNLEFGFLHRYVDQVAFCVPLLIQSSVLQRLAIDPSRNLWKLLVPDTAIVMLDDAAGANFEARLRQRLAVESRQPGTEAHAVALRELADLLECRTRYSESVLLHNQALYVLRILLGDEQTHLAQEYFAFGESTRAREASGDAYRTYRATLGEAHSKTRASMQMSRLVMSPDTSRFADGPGHSPHCSNQDDLANCDG